MKVPPIVVPEGFLWIAKHPNAKSKEDTRIVTLRRPDMYMSLNPAKSEVLEEFANPEELFGDKGSLWVTMLQDPNHLSISEPMYPRLYEVVSHVNFEIAPFAGFCFEELPVLEMTLKRIHTDFCLGNKKIPFRVRLFR